MDVQIEKEKIEKDLGKGKVRTTIEIKPVVVQCNGLHHERIRWHFDPYEVFEIVKNIAKSESELAVMMGSPEEAIKSALKVINRKYRPKNNVILSWKGQGFTKTQETYMRSLRTGVSVEKIDPEGNALVDKKTLIKFAQMKDMAPQIKSKVITEENNQHKNFKLQEIGDVGGGVME